jgi:hypothetical protein
LAEKEITVALKEYTMLKEQRQTLKGSFNEDDDDKLRLDMLNEVQEREDAALNALFKLRDEQDAAA